MEEENGSGKKVAIGRSNTLKKYNTPSTHAEIDAIKKVPGYYLSRGINLCVFGFTTDGELRSSRPCFHCLQSLSIFNIKYVYYSTRDGDIHKEKFSEMLESELTSVSSGMRRKKYNNNK